MTLHPKAAALLEQIAASPDQTLPLQEEPAAIRDITDAAMLSMWGSKIAPCTMREMSVALEGHEAPLRVYRPRGVADDARLPVVFCFHGGGFILGSIASTDPWARESCVGTGAAVISVGYRKAPEHVFPAAAEDRYAALRWASDNAEALSIDPKRMAVAGASAGACLAASVALMCRDRGGPALRSQYLELPCLDARMTSRSYDEYATGFYITKANMADAWRQYVPRATDRDHPYASPLLADDLAGLPPAYILVSGCDPLRDDGARYAERLRKAGVSTTLAIAEGHLHCLTSMRTVFDEEARAAQAPAFAALNAALQ